MSVAIVGIAEHGLGDAGDRSELQLQAEAAVLALEDAGLVTADVDALFTASNDMSWIPSVLVAEYLGIDAKYTDSTNIGGSSFEAHVGHAAAAIEAGLCDVALITYGSNQRSRRSRSLGAAGAVRLTQQFEAPYGLPLPIGAYALAARRHMHLYGTTPAHTHATISNMSHLTQPSALSSGIRAFGIAGVRPDEMDVVELYDSFTITPILSLEMLGFCSPGEGGPFVVDRGTGPTGAFPMDTNSGGLSFCHPGMFGIFLLIEAVRQLRGEAGKRQVPGARLALAYGTGGALSSSATVVLGRG